jgi:hypothetical protein
METSIAAAERTVTGRMASKNVMASSCVFVWYLVARRINPRVFPLNVAIVSFVLRRGVLVSPPEQRRCRPNSKKPGARPGFFSKNQVFAED